MNLHDIVRGVITTIHDDEWVTLYRSIGQVNDRGRVRAAYAAPIRVRAQIQPSPNSLSMTESASRTTNSSKAWLYADHILRPSGINRPLSRNGDFLRRDDGSWWLVTSVENDFAIDGWVSVGITQQIEAPQIEV